MGLGPKVSLPSGLNQCSTHAGQADLPVAQGRSLIGHSTGGASDQGCHWPDISGQVAIVYDALATSPGHPIWPVLLDLLEHFLINK